MEHRTVGGVVGSKELHAAARLGIHVAHHDEEAHTLQHEIGIGVDEGIAAQLNAAGFVLLNGKLVERRAEVRGVVFAEPDGIGSQLYAKHLRDLEFQVEV